jgi:hypothetical protein
MDKEAVAEIFEEIAVLLELKARTRSSAGLIEKLFRKCRSDSMTRMFACYFLRRLV